jgi:hypothetical protein
MTLTLDNYDPHIRHMKDPEFSSLPDFLGVLRMDCRTPLCHILGRCLVGSSKVGRDVRNFRGKGIEHSIHKILVPGWDEDRYRCTMGVA